MAGMDRAEAVTIFWSRGGESLGGGGSLAQQRGEGKEVGPIEGRGFLHRAVLSQPVPSGGVGEWVPQY